MIETPHRGVLGWALPYSDSPATLARNEILLSLNRTILSSSINAANIAALTETGCTKIPEHFDPSDASLTSNIMLQLCGPSLEYPLYDLESKIKFVGSLPPKKMDAKLEYPAWWSSDIVSKPPERKIVFLTQGTMSDLPETNILPFIRALSSVPILLIVALGTRGAHLPSDFAVPENTRVIEYLPYDAILPFSDLFILRAGYGGVAHAVANGVPLVVYGKTEEKAEVCARVEYSGLGIE